MAHGWARELTRLRHEFRLMPARSSAAATDLGDQCGAGAFGRARDCGRGGPGTQNRRTSVLAARTEAAIATAAGEETSRSVGIAIASDPLV
jgi:hypothetical protein